MIKLNGEHVQAAWEDYKGFIQGMGFPNHVIKQIEGHFKQGYALGVSFGEGQAVKPMETTYSGKVTGFVNAEEKPFIKQPKKKTITRQYRPMEQREKEESFVIDYLKNRGKSVPLAELIHKVNENCGSRWTDKNGASFMLTLMKANRFDVARTGRGYYKYIGDEK